MQWNFFWQAVLWLAHLGLAQLARVANTSESEPALFPAKKGQKPPPIFHIKKTDPPIIFIVFLCGNFSHTNSKLQKIN